MKSSLSRASSCGAQHALARLGLPVVRPGRKKLFSSADRRGCAAEPFSRRCARHELGQSADALFRRSLQWLLAGRRDRPRGSSCVLDKLGRASLLRSSSTLASLRLRLHDRSATIRRARGRRPISRRRRADAARGDCGRVGAQCAPRTTRDAQEEACSRSGWPRRSARRGAPLLAGRSQRARRAPRRRGRRDARRDAAAAPPRGGARSGGRGRNCASCSMAARAAEPASASAARRPWSAAASGCPPAPAPQQDAPSVQGAERALGSSSRSAASGCSW